MLAETEKKNKKKVLQDGLLLKSSAGRAVKHRAHSAPSGSRQHNSSEITDEKMLLGNSGRLCYLEGRNFPGAFEEKHLMKKRETAAETVGKVL